MARKYLYDVVVTLNTKGEVILERADKHEGVDGFTPDEGNLILAAMEKTAKEERQLSKSGVTFVRSAKKPSR